MEYRIGIDVGGTNTDAVVVDNSGAIVASIKCPTTTDVFGGINAALHGVLEQLNVKKEAITYAMLGTTHSTNAIVTRKDLLKVGVIRIGKPAGMAIQPMIDWPGDLVTTVSNQVFHVAGGHEFNGKEIFPLDEEALKEAFKAMKGRVEAVAVTSIFSPVSFAHEDRAAALAHEILGDQIPVTLSHEIASIGLLERENAAILNAALNKVARTTALGFKKALENEGVRSAKVYLCQNDGTLMNIDYSIDYPILTIACGPTNSIRGASFLSGCDNALVLDVGGTTSDVGVIRQGFPRESSIAVEIGGVRTNFRMPDLHSLGLGGGSLVKVNGSHVSVGPESVGYRITEEALVFGGSTLTATDIAVRLGLADLGDSSKVAHIPMETAKEAHTVMMDMVQKGIDSMKLTKDPVPLVLVGGGSLLVGNTIEGASEILRPENFSVANALGAAIAQVSGQIERVYSLDSISREKAMEDAKNIATEEAVKAGAAPETVQIVEVDDIPLAYLPGNATRIRVKAVGDLKR
ncbi:MAG: hydantoinase/oxoprolinase family protein [Spirochaetales bacterium]|nr:hydantoinase/oxoprolinase family protein [Spirochaetales bacterium]